MAFEALQQALNQLTGPVNPLFPAQQQDQQSQVDPNQLFNDMIHIAITNKGKFNLQAPPGEDLHLGHLGNQHPVESAATAQALRNGADPNLLNQAAQYLGKNAYLGLCEAFVERMTQGKEGIYASANDAWNQQQNRVQGLDGIKAGDAVYFAPDASNGGYGHTGVYMGNNKYISATYNGIRQYGINDWQNMTGQKVLGYVPSDKHTSIPKTQINQPISQSISQGPLNRGVPQNAQTMSTPQPQLNLAQRQQAFAKAGGKGDLPVGFNG